MVGRARGEGGGPACREGCVLGRFREAEPEDLLVPLNVRPRGLHLPGPRASWLKLRLQVSQPLNRTPRLRGPAGWRGSALGTLAPPWLIHSGLLWAGKGRVGLMCQEPQDHPPPLPLLAELKVGGQDHKVQGGDVHSRSGAPDAACALGGGLLTCMDFGCVACCVPWCHSWFRTPPWKARPVAAHLGSGRRASRPQLTCKCSAL